MSSRTRPVNTQMPKTPIPPTTGSGGSPKLVTKLDLGGSGVTFRTPRPPLTQPGPQTAPSAQGPVRPGAK